MDKIEYVRNNAIHFVQTVLLQSYSNKFNIGKKKSHNMSAIPGTVLKRPAKDVNVLSSNEDNS